MRNEASSQTRDTKHNRNSVRVIPSAWLRAMVKDRAQKDELCFLSWCQDKTQSQALKCISKDTLSTLSTYHTWHISDTRSSFSCWSMSISHVFCVHKQPSCVYMRRCKITRFSCKIGVALSGPPQRNKLSHGSIAWENRTLLNTNRTSMQELLVFHSKGWQNWLVTTETKG